MVLRRASFRLLSVLLLAMAALLEVGEILLCRTSLSARKKKVRALVLLSAPAPVFLGLADECTNVNEQGYGPEHTPTCAYKGCPVVLNPLGSLLSRLLPLGLSLR